MTTAKSSSLGIIARMDLGSGLQSQTLNLCKMLRPDKVLLIDSTPFNKAEQHPELYDDFNTDKVMGFPDVSVLKQWFVGLTHVLTAETMYNDNAVNHAMRMGIKTFIQPNYEFSDYMVRPMTPPTMFLYPSWWHYDDFSGKFENTIYLPPPLFPSDFAVARQENMNNHGRRILHVVGKAASADRNGTQCLLASLNHTQSEFELVIKSQYPLDYQIEDKRVKVEIGNTPDPQDLYKGFDFMVMPRRYGGLCLPMNEALMSGLPVIMTDIEPNNKVLPPEWLAESYKHDVLQTRLLIDVYDAEHRALAQRIDAMLNSNIAEEKVMALDIGLEYSADTLREKYKEVIYGQ